MKDVEGEGSPPVATPSCPVCGEALFDRPVALCTRCKTPHHDDCWHYNEGCATYGCGCRISRAPSPTDDLGGDAHGGPLAVEFRAASKANILDWIFTVGGCLSVAVGSAVSPEGSTAIAYGLFGLIAWVIARITIDLLAKQSTAVLPDEKEIHISRALPGFEYCRRRIRGEDVLELEILDQTILPRNDENRVRSIQALLADGSLVPLYQTIVRGQTEACEALAERWARALGKTIRLLEGREAPPPELVKGLLESHREEARLGGRRSEELGLPDEDDEERLLRSDDDDERLMLDEEHEEERDERP